MTAFDRWAENCESTGTEIWKLESSGDDGLYMTKKPYWQGNCQVWTEPVYHVWARGKWRLTTLNYQKAYNVWRKCRK